MHKIIHNPCKSSKSLRSSPSTSQTPHKPLSTTPFPQPSHPLYPLLHRNPSSLKLLQLSQHCALIRVLFTWERCGDHPRARTAIRARPGDKIIYIPNAVRGVEARGEARTVRELDAEG